MKIDLYICSKPLQYLNICNIPCSESVQQKKFLLVYGVFYDSVNFTNNIRKYDSRWDRVIFCSSNKWFLYVIRYRVNNLFYSVDSTLVGLLHFIKRFNFYLYEEGAGTYTQLKIKKRNRWLAAILGTGIVMGTSKYLKGIFVYHPEYYCEQIHPQCKVFKFKSAFRQIIKEQSNLFLKISQSTFPKNIQVSNSKILLYLTDWDYQITVIERMLKLKKKFDFLFIKPHPQRKKEDMPRFDGIDIIYTSMMVEFLLQFWICNGNEITVMHHNSTAIIPFGGEIQSINLDEKTNESYDCVLRRLTELTRLENESFRTSKAIE